MHPIVPPGRLARRDGPGMPNRSSTGMTWMQGHLSSLNVWLLVRELKENGIHDFGGQENLTIRNGHRPVLHNRQVEVLNQEFHARFHVEVIAQKCLEIREPIPAVLARHIKRGANIWR